MDKRTLAANGGDIETLMAINDFVEENGYPPSLRDVMAQLGTNSTSSVNYRLAYLVKVGWITKKSGVARTIVITEEGKRVIRAQKKQKIAEAKAYQ